jgi:hypothetical protein
MSALLAFVIGTVIFAGLPLCGWGLGDLNGFISEAARCGYILLTLPALAPPAIPGADLFHCWDRIGFSVLGRSGPGRCLGGNPPLANS